VGLARKHVSRYKREQRSQLSLASLQRWKHESPWQLAEAAAERPRPAVTLLLLPPLLVYSLPHLKQQPASQHRQQAAAMPALGQAAHLL
jgi:hypothetical protein